MWLDRGQEVLTLAGPADALEQARERTSIVRHAHKHNGRTVSVAIREACWWIAALDESIERELSERKSDYRDARNEDENGAVILGLKWARNRHSHQLVTATHYGDERPFIPEGGGPPFFISTPYLWMPVESMGLTPTELRLGEKIQPEYERLVGTKVHPSLARAVAWFDSIVSGDLADRLSMLASMTPLRDVATDPRLHAIEFYSAGDGMIRIVAVSADGQELATVPGVSDRFAQALVEEEGIALGDLSAFEGGARALVIGR